MKLFQIIAQNYEIMKGTSALQNYKRELREQYESYSETRTRESLNKIVEMLDNIQDQKFTKSESESILKTIEQSFLNIPQSLISNLMYHSEKLYNDSLEPLKPIQKGEGDQSEEQPVIMKVNPEVIGKLTQGNIVWIKGHANNSAVMNEMTDSMKKWALEGLTNGEIADKIRAEFINLTPQSFKDRFAERDYWKMVTQNQTARIKSYANIDRFENAGYNYYEWVTRGEDVCDICEPMNGMIFEIADARGRINDYYAAAEDNDIDAMKAADPFLKSKQAVPGGIMPQVHPKCYCEIRAKMLRSGFSYDKENRKFIKEVV